MNLLSSNIKHADKVNEYIFNALNDIDVSPEEMAVAERFFDFSHELDITLLENIKFREIAVKPYNNKLYTAYYFIENQKSYVFYDRYILFFDALMGNQLFSKATNIYNLDYYCSRHKDTYDLIRHAYSHKYTDSEIDAKLAAAIVFDFDDSLSDEFIKTVAQNNPEALYNAFKNYCFSDYSDLHARISSINPSNKGQQKVAESLSKYSASKVRLCALALEYNSPKKEARYNKYAPSGTDESKLSPEHAKEMAEFIISVFKLSKNDFSSDDIFELMTSAMFMAKDFSDSIPNILKENISGKKTHFLITLFWNLSTQYFDANIEEIAEIIGLTEDGEFAEKCIKTAITYSWSKQTRNNNAEKKADFILKYCAENFPKSMVSVMYSMDEVKRSSWAAVRDKYFCCFYKEIFNCLKELNPKALTDYNVHFNDDVMDLLVKTELAETDIAHEEIEKYLRGEAELSILEPYYDKLYDAYKGRDTITNNLRLAELCMNCFPPFAKRYYCLSAIEFPGYVSDSVRNGNRDAKYAKFKALFGIFNEDKVPVQFRFAVYSRIIDDIYSDVETSALGGFLLQNMIDRKDKQDGEYKSYCPKGSVFTRKIYVKYLIATDNENNNNRAEITKMFGDSSKEVRRTIIEELAERKEFESDVIGLLKAKKAATREAAVDILLSWGVDSYKDILLETADNEKSAKLADKIRDALAVENPNSGEGVSLAPTALVDELHKGGRNKKLLWLYDTPAPIVHFSGGNQADDKYLQAIMLCYANMTVFGISEKANILAKELNADELKVFVSEILSRWLADGAQSKKKWVLNFAAIHGGSEIIEVFLHYIKDWSENMRGAIAAEAVKALAMNGSSQALMAIDNMAHKFKHKQVKNAAIQALDSAAEALGITSDQLADKIVPDLGFDENMQRIFDYGTRKFKVYLTPSLELEIFDENDKKLKNIPAPGKRDDEETAKKSNAEFKAMKKQLKNVISIQKMRLETAVLADRRWDKTAWEDLFVKNPVMHSFAIGLVWASYEDNKLSQTFRYMEDGTFNTSDEDEYELPENAVIGLVHPIDLDEDTLAAWKEQLEDYEITQPIEQLDRPIYLISDDEIGKLDLERFEGRQINGMSLLGRTAKYGWQKGSVLDAGCFYTFYREDITKRTKNEDGTVILEGKGVELSFEGMYVGGDDDEVRIEKVRFYKPGDVNYGSYMYDHVDDSKAIPLDKISPRYFSEIINQLELITKTAEKKE